MTKRNGIYFNIEGIPNVFKAGNSKIGFDTLIYSMGTAKDCPAHKLGLCSFRNLVTGSRKNCIMCYAAKMEWSSHVREFRKRQADYWMGTNWQTIAKHIKTLVTEYPFIRYIRINETSDMVSMADFKKWFAIAKRVSGITFYTYTHRIDLLNVLDVSSVPDNFIIQSSEQAVKGFNAFLAVSSYDFNQLPKKAMKCPGKCDHCNQCKVLHGNPIYVKLH
jgi:hypothetical protein